MTAYENTLLWFVLIASIGIVTAILIPSFVRMMGEGRKIVEQAQEDENISMPPYSLDELSKMREEMEASLKKTGPSTSATITTVPIQAGAIQNQHIDANRIIAAIDRNTEAMKDILAKMNQWWLLS